MSQYLTTASKILNPDKKTLRDAMETLVRLNKGKLTVFNGEHMRIMCGQLSHFGVEVKVVNDQLVVSAEDFEMQRVKGVIEKYYTAQVTAEEYQAEIQMNEENNLVLMCEV